MAAAPSADGDPAAAIDSSPAAPLPRAAAASPLVHQDRWVVVSTTLPLPQPGAQQFNAALQALQKSSSVLVACKPEQALVSRVLELAKGEHSGIRRAIDRDFSELAERLGLVAAEAVQLLAQDLAELANQLASMSLGNKIMSSATSGPRNEAQVAAQVQLMLCKLTNAALNRAGLAALFLDTRQCLKTLEGRQASDEARYLRGTCATRQDPAFVHALLRQYRASAGAGAGANALLVAQGSVGSDLDGDTVLLGNPDMGAAYLSAALGAQRLEVWSAQRFAGFPSTDPQFDEKALMLERVSYAESVQLAALVGSSVMHPACIPALERAKVPLYLYSLLQPEKPCTIVGDFQLESGVKAVFCRPRVVVVSMEEVGMWNQVGFLANVFRVFQHYGVSIDAVGTSETNVTVSLDGQPSAAALNSIKRDLSRVCIVRVLESCIAISLVGHSLFAAFHRVAVPFAELGASRVVLLSHTGLNLTVVLEGDEELARRLTRHIHKALVLDLAGASHAAAPDQGH